MAQRDEEGLETRDSSRVRSLVEDAVNDEHRIFDRNTQSSEDPCQFPAELVEAIGSQQFQEGDGVKLDDELFDMLQKCIESPEFFTKLESVRAIKRASEPDSPDKSQGMSEEEKEIASYVVVTKEDAIEAMVTAIIANIVECPQVETLNVQELQKAVLATCETLKQGRMRRWMEWGKSAYRLCAIGSTVFQVFTHPWIARAILMGIWQVPKFLIGFLF